MPLMVAFGGGMLAAQAWTTFGGGTVAALTCITVAMVVIIRIIDHLSPWVTLQRLAAVQSGGLFDWGGMSLRLPAA